MKLNCVQLFVQLIKYRCRKESLGSRIIVLCYLSSVIFSPSSFIPRPLPLSIRSLSCVTKARERGRVRLFISGNEVSSYTLFLFFQSSFSSSTVIEACLPQSPGILCPQDIRHTRCLCISCAVRRVSITE